MLIANIHILNAIWKHWVINLSMVVMGCQLDLVILDYLQL